MLVYQLSVRTGISGLVGIFGILSAQSDCTLSEILYHSGEGFRFFSYFPPSQFHWIVCGAPDSM